MQGRAFVMSQETAGELRCARADRCGKSKDGEWKSGMPCKERNGKHGGKKGKGRGKSRGSGTGSGASNSNAHGNSAGKDTPLFEGEFGYY